MKITSIRRSKNHRLHTTKSPVPRKNSNSESLDSVTLSEGQSGAPKGKDFKLGTAFWGAVGATVSAIPLVGTLAISKGSAALPWAMDTEYNDSNHSTLKSFACGAAGLVGGAALNIGGTLACLATGSVLPMIPGAVAGGYLFGKMAQIDSTLGKWELFG